MLRVVLLTALLAGAFAQNSDDADPTDISDIWCAALDCEPPKTCQADSNGTVSCGCGTCDTFFQTVCGSDCNTYFNPCQLKQRSCHEGKDISVWKKGLCPDAVQPEITNTTLTKENSGGTDLVEGETFILECVATAQEYTGTPSLSWWKDGEKVFDGGKYVVTGAGPKDDGVYTCQAMNCVSGKPNVQESEAIQVTVEVSLMKGSGAGTMSAVGSSILLVVAAIFF